jgi:ferredoxin-thioredoxin reductase catalytic chain
LDIICPCDYRDDDLNDFGCCYCALYVSKKIIEKKQLLSSIPERRTLAKHKQKEMQFSDAKNLSSKKPVWRCKVCGYLCGRDSPPEFCPICKAKKERFERFF